MAEVVWSDSVDDEYARKRVDEHPDTGKMIAANKTSIFVDPGNKVAMVKSALVTGPVRGNAGARWWRWHTMESFGFRRTSSGELSPYHCLKNPLNRGPEPWRFRRPDEAISALDGETEAQRIFTDIVKRNFRASTFEELYPMAAHFGYGKYSAIPYQLRGAFKAKDIASFTNRVFGKKRAFLDGTIVHADPVAIALAYEYRGLVRDSYLPVIMHNFKVDDEAHDEWWWTDSPAIRKILLALGQPQRDKFALTPVDADVYMSIVGARELNGKDGKPYREMILPEDRFDGWEEIMNLLRHRRYNRNLNKTSTTSTTGFITAKTIYSSSMTVTTPQSFTSTNNISFP